MPGMERWSWELDGWIIVAGVLCAVSASLLGNFLVLRKMSMLGDAISHAVLPGLAAAFLIGGSRSSLPMFLGAVIVGVLTALITEWIHRAGQVDEGASMGVVFTSLFALGLVIIVQAADHVDLDPGCVLYGAIEQTPWDLVPLMGIEIPRAVVTLGSVLLLNSIFVWWFYKELVITSFDPALADTSGFRSAWLHYALMTLVAITAVASFESVGNILVVAMFVVPAATASLCTDRLRWMIFYSGVFAFLSAVIGHWSAIAVPSWFGQKSTTTAGMMAAVSGFIFVIMLLFAPKGGLLFKWLRHQQLSWSIFGDDLVAFLYRHEERHAQQGATLGEVQETLLSSRWKTSLIVKWYQWTGRVKLLADRLLLTDRGRQLAIALVRSHRLWEQYLLDQAGLTSDRIHVQAEKLEHYTDRLVRDELERQTEFPDIDPHGSRIPLEGETRAP